MPNPIPALVIFDSENYVRANAEETVSLASSAFITVSLARITLLEHSNTGRSRARWQGVTHNTLPYIIIRGIRRTDEPDDAGNNLFADVQYSAEGYLATYGGKVTESGRIAWQCYMD